MKSCDGHSAFGDSFRLQGAIQEGCTYEGVYFPGYTPIWIRPPASGERCFWTASSHGGFYNLLNDYREELVIYKLNADSDSGTILYWLPTLLHAVRSDCGKTEERGPYSLSATERRQLLFPPIPSKFIRAPERGSYCPWTSLSQSSFLNLQKRYRGQIGRRSANAKDRGTTLIYLPDLIRVMMQDTNA